MVAGRLLAFWWAGSSQPLGVWVAVAAANALSAWCGAYVLERGSDALVARAWLADNAVQSITVQYFIWSVDNIGLLVTHDVEEALLLADRVVFMSGGVFRDEFSVSAPRPRIPEEYFETEQYKRMHARLLDLFYQAEETKLDQADREQVFDGGEML